MGFGVAIAVAVRGSAIGDERDGRGHGGLQKAPVAGIRVKSSITWLVGCSAK